MNWKRLPLFILIAAVLVSRADTGFRKYAGEFMTIDVSARAQAMGGAFTAVANDVSAAFYNPAGLVQVQSTQLALMHAWQFVDFVNYDYVGFLRPMSNRKALAFSLIRLGIDDIKDTRAALIQGAEDWRLDWSKIKSFNAADYLFLISLGQAYRDNLFWGLTAKLVRRSLADNSAMGIGFDAGILYQVSPHWRLAAVVKNVTSTLIAWNTGEKELVRPTVELGSSYRVEIPTLQSYFIPGVNFRLRSESYPVIGSSYQPLLGSGLVEGALGGEFGFRDVLFLRGGVDELSRLTLGLGVRIPHLLIDYSFLKFDQELGNSHRIGLLINFGG